MLSLLTAVADVHDVAILHDVFLALESKGSLGASGGLASGGEQVVPANRFGADEVVLEIGVDSAGGLRGF